MKFLKILPNILTVYRLLSAASLLIWAKYPASDKNHVVFVVVFLVAALTDAFDGIIARKFGGASNLGAKLDSLADFSMFCFAMPAMIFFMKFHAELPQIMCVIGAALVKLINFIITKVKFKQWNVIHTVANKSGGFFLICSVPVFVIVKGFNFWVILILALLMAIPALEEMIILLKSKEYDVNNKGLFFKKKV